LEEARHTKQDYAEFLQNMLDCEWRLRLENGQVRRIKEAKFPLKKHLCDFKRDKYDTVFLPKFEELETLAFIPNKENISCLAPLAPARPIMLLPLASPPV